jgi:hypothetical protein
MNEWGIHQIYGEHNNDLEMNLSFNHPPKKI